MIRVILYWRRLSLAASCVKSHTVFQQMGQLLRGMRKKDKHNWIQIGYAFTAAHSSLWQFVAVCGSLYPPKFEDLTYHLKYRTVTPEAAGSSSVTPAITMENLPKRSL